MASTARATYGYTTRGGSSSYGTRQAATSRSTYSRTRSVNAYGSAAPDLKPQREPNLRPVPGRRTAPKPSGLSQTQVNVFKAIVAVAAALIVVATLRIALSAATVQQLQSVETLQSGIEQAYASADEAEIEHSVLSSTQRIKEQANSLGLVSATEKVYIQVPIAAQLGTSDDGKPCVYKTIKNIKKAKKLSKIIGS